ncbi:Clp protease N-terminal domain-containing protein [Actinocorallia lasiicapitis]
MFERFTRDAREAVVAAQAVARGMGHDAIDTGHLLIALHEQDGIARRALLPHRLDPAGLRRKVRDLIDGLDPDALASIGIDLHQVREAAEAAFGPGALDPAGPVRSGHIPFKPESKKLLELSLRQALQNKDKFICGAHLLLAALTLPGSTATRALTESGTDLDDLHTALLREIAAKVP